MIRIIAENQRGHCGELLLSICQTTVTFSLCTAHLESLQPISTQSESGNL